MVGVFAVSELLVQAGRPEWRRPGSDTRVKLPDFATWRRLWRPQFIGSLIGTFEGCMPGAGGSVAAFMSYNEARRWSSRPEEFGKGSPEAIAAPETANNAVACTALVPTLTFGIPGSNSTAVLLGGFLIHGLQPGPLLFVREPEFIYGLYGGLAVANLSLAVLGILVLTPCLWLVSRPKPYLLAGIYALIFSGVYSINHSLLGQGADAIVLRVADGAPGSTTRDRVDAMLGRSLEETHYTRFLAHCGLLEVDFGMRAERDNRTAHSASYRRQRDLTAFIGGRCTRCGTVQFPRSSACVNPECRAFDTQVDHPLAETQGRVKSFTEDWLAYTARPPFVYGNVALEGGGNAFIEFADTMAGELAIGREVEFVFRIKDVDRRDALARTVLAPLELPVGIITALIGGPFFLWLLLRSR
jgi:uncharacterized OB-fold protein